MGVSILKGQSIMKIDSTTCPYPLSTELVTILQSELNKIAAANGEAVTLNFRDPDYSVENGGFHPVEIRVSDKGAIVYITDFSFAGTGPFVELVKEIDFDFGLRLFQHFCKEFPIEAGAELFGIWCENFTSYYRMNIFDVTSSIG